MWKGVSLLLFVTAALLTDDGALAAPPAVDKWTLWSDGAKLRGANVFQRRRYTFDGPEFLGPGPLGPPYTQQDFDRLAALGANAVLFSHPGLFSEDPPYVVDADVQGNLDRFVAMAAAAGLYVIIGFRTGPGRSEATFDYFPDASYDNERVWTDQQAHDAWGVMWRYAAQRYKDNTAIVGYDLMVEPNSNGRLLGIYDPKDFYPRYAGTLYDWNALYPSIIRAIREVDAATPILVGGMNWSSVQWLPYLQPNADLRTVYAVHYYEPFVYTHQDPSSLTLTYPGTFDPGSGTIAVVNQQWLRSSLAPIDSFKSANPGRPVAVTEFGVRRWVPGAAEYFTDVTAIFEEQRVSHIVWLWSSSWPPTAAADEFDFRHGPDPNLHDDVQTSALLQAVRADFARNRATCPAVAVSPTTLPPGGIGVAFHQTFTASGGVAPYTFTELGALPPGLTFASGALSGVPSQSGSFPIVVTATDANGCSGAQSYTLSVQAVRRRAVRQ